MNTGAVIIGMEGARMEDKRFPYVTEEIPPSGFRLPKPITIEHKTEIAFFDRHRYWVSVKYDGIRLLAVRRGHGLRWYTSHMHDITHVMRSMHVEFDACLLHSLIPMLDVEFCHVDGFTHALKALASPDALAAQRRHVFIRVLDVYGNRLHEMPFTNRYVYMMQIKTTRHVAHVSFHTLSQAGTSLDAIARGYEGLIIRDSTARPVFSYNGKSAREGFYKWKPMREDSFLAYDADVKNGTVRAIHIARLNANTGAPEGAGKVGSGLSEAMRHASAWQFPCIIDVKYQDTTANGRLKFPVFLRRRDDVSLADYITEHTC